jgi:hypothetical protein
LSFSEENMLNTQVVPLNPLFYTIFRYHDPFSESTDGEGEYNVKKVTMILGKSSKKIENSGSTNLPQ